MKLNKNYPVFANTRPWNELVLRGVRKFKTLSHPWKYRGIIYLYDTLGKPDDYGFDWAAWHGIKTARSQTILMRRGRPGHIVGTVEICGVRSFDDCHESDKHEVLLRNPMRFAKPIPFKWPNGAIRIARIK